MRRALSCRWRGQRGSSSLRRRNALLSPIDSLTAVILEVSVRLAGAGRQVRRCIADSTGATEHDNLGGTKARQLREGRGRYAVPLGKEQRCAGKGRHGGAGEGIGVVRPGRELRGVGALRVGTQRNRRGRFITVSASPPLPRRARQTTENKPARRLE